MSDKASVDQKVDRVTVIAKEFSAAALEYHRQRLGQQGYSIEGPIGRHKFVLVDENGQAKEMFGGEEYFAASFSKTGA